MRVYFLWYPKFIKNKISDNSKNQFVFLQSGFIFLF